MLHIDGLIANVLIVINFNYVQLKMAVKRCLHPWLLKAIYMRCAVNTARYKWTLLVAYPGNYVP